MDIDTILSAFTKSTGGTFPKAALQAAIAKKQEISPHLLTILEDAGRDIDAVAQKKNDYGFLYAMFLLAQFREREALQPLLRFFSTPGQTAIALTGDVVTESLGQLLAGVSAGDIAPIQTMIENSDIDPFVRAAGLEALLCLVAWGEASPPEVITYFSELLDGRLEQQPSHVWNYLAEAVSRLCGPDLTANLMQAYDKGLISPLYMNWTEAEKMLNRPVEENLKDLEKDAGLAAITDVIAEMENWACFRPQEQRIHRQDGGHPVAFPDKTGRNEPCPCGSGKKYKKCCLHKS